MRAWGKQIQTPIWFAGLALAAVLTLGGVVGVLTVGQGRPVITVAATSPELARLGETFAPIVQAQAPAVVNISSSKEVRGPEHDVGPLLQDPVFRRFFGEQFPELFRAPKERMQRSLGSGVIVSADGYILTNNHVVENAQDIRISLNDTREFTGRVVGADPKTDLAVVKIDQSGLHPITFGDSKTVRPGDIALAIGNPFGLGGTVTMGVISATGRGGLGIEEIEDFIQTDAAVNPGNSGGALVNTRGELIGINTAILSPSGGNLGIGFAVPVSLARDVMDQIIRTGKVTRAWLGVALQEVTADIAATFHLDKPRGALVADVEERSPASTAGIQTGDIILAIDQKPVTDARSLQLALGQMTPGKAVRLTVFRNGQERDVNVTLSEQPAQTERGSRPRGSRQPSSAAPRGGPEFRGLSVQTLDPNMAAQLGLSAKTQGVIVTDVEPGSAADDAGLQHGDVILETNRQPVRNPSEFEAAMSKNSDSGVVLLVNRGGRTHYVTIRRELQPR
jgi:serine protease Do